MGFGSDFAGVDDLDANWTYLSGTENEALALKQAIARRYITPRGGNPWDPGYGLDLRSFVSDTIDPAQAEPMIINEALKDERIQDCTAVINVVPNPSGDTWEITIHCTATDGLTFDLVLGVSQVSVELLNASEVTA